MLGAVAQCLVWKVALKEEEVEEEREEVKDGWRRQARSLLMCFSRLIILEKVLNYIFYKAKQFVSTPISLVRLTHKVVCVYLAV